MGGGSKERTAAMIDRVADALLAMLNAALVMIMLAAVFFRYVVGRALAWSDELVRYLFVWFSLLGMALALRERDHIRVEYFALRLPAALRRRVEAAVLAVIGLFLAAITVLGFAWVHEMRGATTTALQWPLNWLFYAALPCSAALDLWFAIRRWRRAEWAERDLGTEDDPPSEGTAPWDS